MDRRELLQAATAGTVVGLAGCVDGVIGGGDGCDPTAFDGLSRTWPHENGGPGGRRYAGDELPTDLSEQWSETFEDADLAYPYLVGRDTMCCLVGAKSGTTIEFLDAATGDRQWTLSRNPTVDDTDLSPPDGTTAHESVDVLPQAIADGIVYVSAWYSGERTGEGSILTGGVFALDAADGSVEWSAPTPGRPILRLDAAGRLFAAVGSTALSRAAPEEQELTAGEWRPDSQTGKRLHAYAWNARTGDSCWEWDVEASDQDASLFGLAAPVVTGGTAVVMFRHGDVESERDREIELFCLDAGDGEEQSTVTFTGPLSGVFGVDGRLVGGTRQPPIEDASTDGASLFAIDLDEAEFEWVVTARGAPGAATDDRLITTGAGVDVTTGDTDWTADIEGVFVAVTDDGILTLAETELRWHALDSGTITTRTSLSEVTDTTLLVETHEGVVTAGGRLYVRADDGDDVGVVTFG